jgi:hypothetical protein
VKKINTAIALMVLAILSLGVTAGQKTTTREPIKRTAVTSKDITRQPPGKVYVLDLSRKGTIYTLDADDGARRNNQIRCARQTVGRNAGRYGDQRSQNTQHDQQGDFAR